MDSLPDFKDLLIVVVLQLKDFFGGKLRLSHRCELSGVYQLQSELKSRAELQSFLYRYQLVSVFLDESQWPKYIFSHDYGQMSIFTLVSFSCWDELFHLIDKIRLPNRLLLLSSPFSSLP